VTVLLTEMHLRKMIDDHLVKEDEISDQAGAWIPNLPAEASCGTRHSLGPGTKRHHIFSGSR